MKKIVDIILLTYNNLYNTKECIKNLYDNTNINDFNLIVLDNNSKEETREYLKIIFDIYSNIYLSFQQQNLGVIRGRNYGYYFSRKYDSPYVCFLDNDQFVKKNWLNSYLKLLKEYDIVGAEGWLMRKDFYPIRKVKINEQYSYVGAGGMFIKRKVTKDIGLFNTMFKKKYFEDPDLIFRAHKKGYKICWNKEDNIYHNHKGNLLNKETKKLFSENLKKFQKKWKGFDIPVLNN